PSTFPSSNKPEGLRVPLTRARATGPPSCTLYGLRVKDIIWGRIFPDVGVLCACFTPRRVFFQ
ncbi:unnamed protein product, partial [Nesidiocoris tenuis]